MVIWDYSEEDDREKMRTEDGWCYLPWHDGDCCEGSRQDGATPANLVKYDVWEEGYDMAAFIVPEPKRYRRPWELWIMRNMKRICIYHKARAAHFEFEWHNHSNVRYLAFGIASPTEHKWWSISITIYTSLGHGPNLLGWIPSKVYRYYGKGR